MPLRLRLSLIVFFTTLVVAIIGGYALNESLASGIKGTMHDALRRSAGRVISDLHADRLPLSTGGANGPTKNDQSVIQVVGGPPNSLLLTTETAGPNILISPKVAAVARHSSLFIQTQRSIWATPYLLLAEPIPGETGKIVVVGTSLDEFDNALAGLRRSLIIGGSIVVFLASLGGYFLARRALAPVDRFCIQAEEFSGSLGDRRLTVARTNDELEHLGRTLNAMLERIQIGSMRQRRFVAAASHELRTPLATIQAEIDVMRLSNNFNSDIAASFDTIAERVTQLSRLSGDLLLLASGDEDTLRVDLRPQQVEPIIAASLQGLRHKAAERSVHLVIHCASDATATLDSVSFRHIIENLVNNALEHGGSRTKVIEVRFDHDETWDVLSVSDDGPGIPTDFIPHAFERFSRPPTSRVPGSGLGLSVVSMLAHAHRGRVSIENRPSGGTQATVLFPSYNAKGRTPHEHRTDPGDGVASLEQTEAQHEQFSTGRKAITAEDK